MDVPKRGGGDTLTIELRTKNTLCKKCQTSSKENVTILYVILIKKVKVKEANVEDFKRLKCLFYLLKYDIFIKCSLLNLLTDML